MKWTDLRYIFPVESIGIYVPGCSNFCKLALNNWFTMSGCVCVSVGMYTLRMKSLDYLNGYFNLHKSMTFSTGFVNNVVMFTVDAC